MTRVTKVSTKAKPGHSERTFRTWLSLHLVFLQTNGETKMSDLPHKLPGGNNLIEIIKLFLKLGLIAFGGPAVHIGMMEEEVVSKRKWMSRQHFLDLVGATNLIPGPNSTEMAIHCGYVRAGLPGLILAGMSFILPAFLITTLIAYFYIQYGKMPEIKPFLYGIKPAVIIIILNAVYKLGVKAVKGWKLITIAAAAAIMNFLGVSEIFSILAGGILGAAFILIKERRNNLFAFTPLTFFTFAVFNCFMQNPEKSDVSLSKLFWVFFKIGALLFGSGYVLVAYLDGEIVQGLSWMSRKELLDAIAIGQFTPGPVLSAAAFVGYQIAGLSGAVLGSIGIFLPSFIYVLIINPVIPRLRNSKIFSVFLDAVNVSSIAVMFVIGLKLGAEVLIDWPSVLIALLGIIAFLTIKKLNSAYLVIGGALAGYLFYLIFK